MPGPIFHVFFYQVNDILAISSLGNTANDPLIPNGANYILANSALTHETAGTYIGSSPGLTTAQSMTAKLNAGSDKTLTFSITDFNELRIKTANALLAIGNKIDEILNIASLPCDLAYNNLR